MDVNSDFSTYCKNECRIVESAVEMAKTQEEFLAIHQRLLGLELRLNERSASLPSYTLKQLQTALASVKQRATQAHNTAMPKAKFSFAKRGDKATPKADSESSNELSKQRAAQKDEVSGTAEKRIGETKKITIENDAAALRTLRISELSNQTICKFEADCESSENSMNNDAFRVVELSNLENCRVLIAFATSTVHCDALRDCVVVCAPSRGSVFVDSCTNCVFAVGAQQLRVHRTTGSRFVVHISAGSIIEDCNAVQFARWPDSLYTRFADLLAKLDSASTNNWCNVEDFNHLDRTSHSPNWSTLENIADADLLAIQYLTQLSPETAHR